MGTQKVVIVGGGLAASRTAEQLRRAEYVGADVAVVIVSDEAHLPYDRPPLSKDVLHRDDHSFGDVTLKPREFYDDNNIELKLGSSVTSVDTAARSVTLADGSTVDYDELVIATGLVPRRIPSGRASPPAPTHPARRGAPGRRHRRRLHRLRGDREPA